MCEIFKVSKWPPLISDLIFSRQVNAKKHSFLKFLCISSPLLELFHYLKRLLELIIRIWFIHESSLIIPHSRGCFHFSNSELNLNVFCSDIPRQDSIDEGCQADDPRFDESRTSDRYRASHSCPANYDPKSRYQQQSHLCPPSSPSRQMFPYIEDYSAVNASKRGLVIPSPTSRGKSLNIRNVLYFMPWINRLINSLNKSMKTNVKSQEAQLEIVLLHVESMLWIIVDIAEALKVKSKQDGIVSSRRHI